jgi:hypothetical protein
VGDHRIVDCRVSCKCVSLPESGHSPGIADNSPAPTSIAGRVHFVGVLAHTESAG